MNANVETPEEQQQDVSVCFRIETCELRQLHQLMQHPVWDGDLIDKSARDHLEKAGLINRLNGWNFLSLEGIRTLLNMGYLKPRRQF
jgi:hypothetical protein